MKIKILSAKAKLLQFSLISFFPQIKCEKVYYKYFFINSFIVGIENFLLFNLFQIKVSYLPERFLIFKFINLLNNFYY